MGSVFRGPSSGSPTPREEGVVWSHVSLWKPGSLSRAITPPQNPKTPQDPALHGQEVTDAEKRVPVGVRLACVPLCRRITSSEIRMTT